MRRPGRHPRSKLARPCASQMAPPKVLAVELQQVEGNQETCRPEGLRRSRANTATPLSSEATASPSIRQERVLSRFTATTMSGYRENPRRRGRRALHHHRVHHPSGGLGWILFFALALGLTSSATSACDREAFVPRSSPPSRGESHE